MFAALLKGKEERAEKRAQPHAYWEEGLSAAIYDVMLNGCDTVRMGS